MPGRTIVIVGASLAGARAAETLRSEGFDGRVVLVGDEPHLPYERPPLSKEILRGEWEPPKAYLRDSETHYADAGIELMLGTRATAIDTDARRLKLGTDDIAYDELLLCTGGRARTLPVPGADLANIYTLRTIEDARAIGATLKAGAKVAVVGAGFIGAEVAASARMLGAEVTVVEVFETMLVRALGAEVGEHLADIHRGHGVELLFDARGERFEGGDDGAVRALVLADGRRIDADVVVVGVGISPADELARAALIACDNGIVVDEQCRTSAPNVWAAGDVAEHPNPILGERVRLEHWSNAQNQAAAAAKAMLGSTEPFAEVPWFWSDQYDRNIQMFGHPVGWDRLVTRGDPSSGSFAAYHMAGDRIVSSFSVNRTKDARAVKPLIASRAPVEDAVLADEGTDLRALAKQLAT